MSSFVHLITWINFWSARRITHFCILVHTDNDKISAVQVHFLKAITKTFTVKWHFLHLTGFHLQCNLIQPFQYHSQPLTFSFQSETVIFTFLDLQIYIYKTVGFSWVGQKIIPNVGIFPTVSGLFLLLKQSYGQNPTVIISTVCCTPLDHMFFCILNNFDEINLLQDLRTKKLKKPQKVFFMHCVGRFSYNVSRIQIEIYAHIMELYLHID